jgi:hypothetical protein
MSIYEISFGTILFIVLVVYLMLMT